MVKWNEHDDEGSAKQIFDLIKPIQVPLASGQEEELCRRMKERLEALYGQSNNFSRQIIPVRWISSAAAVLLIVAGIWVFFNGRMSVASTSFGEMIKRIAQAKSVQYDLVCSVSGKPDEEYEVVAVPGGSIRTTGPEGKVNIRNGKTRLTLSPQRKRALRRTATATSDDDYVSALLKLTEPDGELVERVAKDGQDLVVFKVNREGKSMTVWANGVTLLPYRIEVRETAEKSFDLVVLRNFRWNKEIDPSLFSIEIPPGYQDIEVVADEEEALVVVLRTCLDKKDGQLPQHLDRQTLFDAIAHKAKTYRSGSDPTGRLGIAELDKDAEVEWSRCLPGILLIERLRNAGAWIYVGGEAPQDPQAIIAVWRTSATGIWKAIHRDLSVHLIDDDGVDRIKARSAQH